MHSLRTIPLSSLLVSPHNVRKTGGKQVADLATSIVEHGLLHNLTVIAAANDQFEVIDGGRRLAALQSLVKRKKLAKDFAVPCLVRTDIDAATELSAAANAFTEPMHPADQCEAFKRMIDQHGATIADVAARFSVSELVVRQRLKLANVSPKLVDVYRTGKMNLDQLQVLALSDDQAAQEKAWFGVKHDYERSAHSLRERITKALISPSDRRVKLIGLDAYEAAGGTVIRDLFSTRGEGYLTDPSLLDQLVAAKLQATVDELRADGWSWVEINPGFSEHYEAREEYSPVPAQRVQLEPSPEQTARMAVIAEREQELLPLMDVLDAIDDRTAEQAVELDRYETEMQSLGDERDDISARLLTFAAEVKAVAGAIVTLGYNGVEVHEGRLRPGEKLAKGSIAVTPAAPKPAKPTHSDSVNLSLSAHRSAVARYHVMGDPKLALALMVEWLLVKATDRWGDAQLLRLSPTSVRDPLNLAPDLDPTLLKQMATAEAFIDAVIARKDPLGWLLEQTEQELLELLAIGVGTRFDGITAAAQGDHAGVKRLHLLAGFDMAQHWKPTAKQYLSRVSADVVLAAVKEACGKEQAAALSKLRKPELVARAEPLLTAKRWLPKVLRTPKAKKGA